MITVIEALAYGDKPHLPFLVLLMFLIWRDKELKNGREGARKSNCQIWSKICIQSPLIKGTEKLSLIGRIIPSTTVATNAPMTPTHKGR